MGLEFPGYKSEYISDDSVTPNTLINQYARTRTLLLDLDGTPAWYDTAFRTREFKLDFNDLNELLY